MKDKVSRAAINRQIEHDMRVTREAAELIGAMTANHPRWQEFYDAMEGPGGCDFRERVEGDPDTITWNCDNSKRCSIARGILKRMGFSEAKIEASIIYFHAHGGHCDCEILFNVKPRSAR